MGTIQPRVEQAGDEISLVHAAKAGDISAFEELVRRYDRNVFRIAQHITQNREDAEDVVQDAFLKAYQNLANFQEQSKFYTWLVRIAVNEALMRLRRRRPERMVSLDEDIKTEEDSMPREVADWSPNPEQLYSQGELKEILGKTIQGLPPSFRTVFVLRDVEGPFHRRDGGRLGFEYSGSEVAVASRPAAVAGTLEQVFQKSYRRRWQTVTCSDFLKELTDYLDDSMDSPDTS